jgi:fatty acid amide hydrolase
LDFIICPGFGSQALRHGFAKHTSLAVAYTFIWNVLNLPSGCIPVTVVRNDEQVYESRYDDMITKALKESARGSAGLPVGIQVIGLPYQ